MFWKPEKGEFSDEDLLVYPNGEYITHLHDRPASSGRWSLRGDTLTLDHWLGDRTFVIRGLRIDGDELRGSAEGAPLVMRRAR